jgi:hypothetical protein
MKIGGHLMEFDKHAFISYAHIDNQPLNPDQLGWISRFHKSLEWQLSTRLGSPAKIWRDEKLQGNDIFSREIISQFPQTALLISVLSPRYLNSEWCTREVQEFCDSAERTGGLSVDNKARLFKVIKTPLDTADTLPGVMRSMLGYEFFTFDGETPLELDPAYGDKFAQEYNRKVAQVAHQAAELLKKLAGQTRNDGQPEVAAGPAKPAVYLAECSYDRREARDLLEGELRLHGYPVLPDHQLPREEAEYLAAVERILARCLTSIHLIGENYGAVLDGPSQKSIVVLQNELAVQRSKKGGMPRIIWLKGGTISVHPQQQAFIKALLEDNEAQFAADLIAGDIEECKAAVHAALKKLETPQPDLTGKPAAGVKQIYLVCDEKDRRATIPLRKFFREHGFGVELPVFEGDAAAVREANRRLLVSCDAVLLFYGAGDEAWKRTVDNELKKVTAGRNEPLAVTYTYLAAPRTGDKEDLLDMEEPHLINGLGDFSETAMSEFLGALIGKGSAS